jgi:hypothetical protein
MSEDFDSNASEAAAPLWATQSWLQERTLRTLAEVNDDCLQLVCEQARAGGRSGVRAPLAAQPSAPAIAVPALLAELRQPWCELDVAARRRAARCSYLIFDAGFTETRRWGSTSERPAQDQTAAVAAGAFFTLPRTVEVMRLVMTYAWHLARSQSPAARLLLGMSPGCAELIGTCTLRQVTQLAETHPHWLRPRWPERVSVWRELLRCASGSDAAALERIHHRGVQLLAAEVRAFM